MRCEMSIVSTVKYSSKIVTSELIRPTARAPLEEPLTSHSDSHMIMNIVVLAAATTIVYLITYLS